MGIHLTREQYQSILRAVSSMSPTSELEATFKGRLDSFRVKRLLSYLKATGASEKELDYQLDISSRRFDNHRITLTGLDKISTFCASGRCDEIEVIQKLRGQHYVDLSQHDFVIKQSDERDVSPGMKVQLKNRLISNDIEKTFRLKKRTCYMLKHSPRFRIDVTSVKTRRDEKQLSEAFLNDAIPHFEVEVEYIGQLPSNENAQEADSIATELLRICAETLKVMDDCDYLIPKGLQYDVIKNYAEMVFGYNPARISKALEQSPKQLFAGPQPVSLELENLQSNAGKTPSIMSNYTVTHKADGVRALLYVDKDGGCYLLNISMQVRKLRYVVRAAAGSLFDVEVIQQAQRKDLFIFDAYYWNKKAVHALPLEHHEDDNGHQKVRMDYARQFTDMLEDDMDTMHRVRTKTFLVAKVAEELFEHCKTLLAEDTLQVYGFKTDGLIFTPKDLGAGVSMGGGDAPGKTHPLSGTWFSTFKWKPPSQNTIDFLVRFEKTSLGQHMSMPMQSTEGLKLYKRLLLFVGADLSTNPKDYLISRATQRQQQSSRYGLTVFNPSSDGDMSASYCDLEYDVDGRVMCGADIIEENTIVEMHWDYETMRWKPLHIRTDKTELFRASRNISGTANDINVALKVWRTIQNPITVDHITGNTRIETFETISREGEYYVGNKKREGREGGPLFATQLFHNYWIKRMTLLNTFQGRCSSLMDIACGMGGDIDKWVAAGFQRVLGIDLFERNITHPVHGAYARLRNRDDKDKTSQYVFLPLSAAETVDEDHINKIASTDTREVAKCVWGLQKPLHAGLEDLYGMATKKFDIVSCQFAIHYFFKDDSTLAAFCENVAAHLKDGGYFVGTCFDAAIVNNKIRSHGSDVIEYKSDDNRLIWKVTKGYGRYDGGCGNKIGVYVCTINQEFDEYLVDFELLQQKLSGYGIHLVSDEEAKGLGLIAPTSGFKESFDQFCEHYRQKVRDEGQTSLKKWEKDVYANMTQVNKEFSFLNRWFVFKKALPAAAAKKPVRRVKKTNT